MIITDFRKNEDLYKEIKEIVPEAYLIGDAKEEGYAYIVGSTLDGAMIGCAL